MPRTARYCRDADSKRVQQNRISTPLVGATMTRLILPLVVLLAALTGCAADDSRKTEDSRKPDAAWAMSMCTRDLQEETDTKGSWTTGPLGFRLIKGRAVTMAEAKDLMPPYKKMRDRLPLVDGKVVTGFAASCKVRFAHPDLAHFKKGAQPAILAFKGGSNLWVDDQYWAK